LVADRNAKLACRLSAEHAMHPFLKRRGNEPPTLAQIAKAVLERWNEAYPYIPMRLSPPGNEQAEQDAFTFEREDGQAHPLGLRWSKTSPGQSIETFFVNGYRTCRRTELSHPDPVGNITDVLHEQRGEPYGLGEVLRTIQAGLDAIPALRDAFKAKYGGPYPGLSDHHQIELWPNQRVPGCLVHGVSIKVEDNRARVEILRYGHEDLGDGLTVRPLLGYEIRPWHQPTSSFLATDLVAALRDNLASMKPWVGLQQGTHPRTREVHVEVKAALDALVEMHPADEEFGPMVWLRLNDSRNLKVGAPDVIGFKLLDGTDLPVVVRVGDDGAEILAGEDSRVVSTYDYMHGLNGMREELVRLVEPCLEQAPAMAVFR
jgi:hypothetical protein